MQLAELKYEDEKRRRQLESEYRSKLEKEFLKELEVESGRMREQIRKTVVAAEGAFKKQLELQHEARFQEESLRLERAYQDKERRLEQRMLEELHRLEEAALKRAASETQQMLEQLQQAERIRENERIMLMQQLQLALAQVSANVEQQYVKRIADLSNSTRIADPSKQQAAQLTEAQRTELRSVIEAELGERLREEYEKEVDEELQRVEDDYEQKLVQLKTRDEAARKKLQQQLSEVSLSLMLCSFFCY